MGEKFFCISPICSENFSGFDEYSRPSSHGTKPGHLHPPVIRIKAATKRKNILEQFSGISILFSVHLNVLQFDGASGRILKGLLDIPCNLKHFFEN
ncbi:MAG TPA: hypothetical protein P5105_06950, partial [Victivallales bacterium]|nr:hypothetical protein [Victivallales bacterium]